MNNRIFWLVIILSAFTIGFSSCAKDTEVVDPYANWKERNEHFIDSIADVADNPPSGEIWRKYENYKIKFDDINNSYRYQNYDYVYVKYAKEEDIFTGKEPLINFTDTVSLAFQGFIMDGTRFDGNYYGTFDKEVNDNFTKYDISKNYVVGWTTALMHMKPDMSDKATVYVPYQMGYDDENRSEVLRAYSALIFEMYIDEVIHPYSTSNSDN
ncbi:FKBP-type peptidyl-prolyl cis-trans isomerase [Bacteroides caecigallinarum]|uniref:Peptidyl-prolyl cis-trans isomerase n=1 Tax=Candidatus Phocaeicola faecigallinarum TaxID=2838732 RepID=A0A948TB11_9BACT|nr:FKBP-type peptidyl-prolyl cis-trans isomerase [Bacteroides caecigallinarum]MBU3837425.1 FKBP-type peptidyl-prolyl cis-trans isomerase [Candidatus Phocaeicola faecigallinarum]MCF2580635.1 FKBP-type peptidyl-prolyl cis-trans isomerase [Bacteroides caecigallinarum]